MEQTESERRDAIQGLRDVVAFLEEHPNLPAPRFTTMNTSMNTLDELAAIARETTWQKAYNGSYFSLRKVFLGDLTLDYFVPREEVCSQVVVGTRTVPSVEARPEREEDVIEWVCDSSLLGER